MKNKIIKTGMMLVFFLTGACTQLFARIQNPPIDGKEMTPAQRAELGHLVWYEEPWLWFVAVMLFVLVLVATRKVKVHTGNTTPSHSHGSKFAD